MAWMGITVTGDDTTRPALTTSLWWPFEHAADPFASARDAALDLRPPSIALHQVRREGTGDALGLQWVGRVHELEVHVGSGRVTSVPDQPQDLTGPNHLARGDQHGARSQVREQREDLGALHDHLDPGHQVDSAPGRSNLTMGFQRDRELTHHLDQGQLGHGVHGCYDLAVKRGVAG
jgi:hypothetical protein